MYLPGPNLFNDGANFVNALPNTRPGRGQQHHDRQSPVREVLLMTEILIRRHQELVGIPLRLVKQCTIAKIRPPSLESGIHHVFVQLPP